MHPTPQRTPIARRAPSLVVTTMIVTPPERVTM
jgi:hypothetical protein